MARLREFMGRADVRDVAFGVVIGVSLGTLVTSWVYRSAA